MLSILIRPILTVLVLFVPLYPKFPLQAIPGTYVAIRLDDIVISLCLFIWFLYQIKKGLPFLKEKISLLFLLYFLAISLSTIHALFIFQTDPPHLLLLHLFRRFEYMSVFFITLSAVKDRSHFTFVYLSFLLTTTLVCLYGYGQKYLNFPIISTMNSEFAKGQLLQMANWSRISSTFAGHYDLAAYLSVSLVIILAVSLRLKNKFFKFFSLICFLLAFHNLVLTASRVSVFAFWGAATITLLLIKKYFWVIPISLLVIFSLFTSKELNQRLIATLYTAFPTKTPTTAPTIPAPTLAPVTAPVIKVPVKKTTPLPTPLPTVTRHQIEEEIPIDADSGVARSGEIRFNAEWPRAITAYKKNPLLGTGLGSITLATDNDYLRLLGESGLLGFITLSGILLFFFVHTFFSKKSKNNKTQQHLNFIFFGALLSFLANAVFIDVFEASKTAYMFWIMMALYYQNIKHG